MPTTAKPKAAMPKFTSAPEELVRAFDRAALALPLADRRKMFGYPSLFTNGQMFAGLFQDRMMLRLSEADRAQFLKLKGAKPFEPMPGRPMKEYVEVPPAVLKSEVKLDEWLGKGFEYAKTLPPKVKKGKKTK